MRYLILCLFIAGCSSFKGHQDVKVEGCKNVPNVCWGQVGTKPSDVPICTQLINCYNWEMRAK